MLNDSNFETSMAIIWTMTGDEDLGCKWTALYSYYLALVDMNENDLLHDFSANVLFLMSIVTELEELQQQRQQQQQ